MNGNPLDQETYDDDAFEERMLIIVVEEYNYDIISSLECFYLLSYFVFR